MKSHGQHQFCKTVPNKFSRMEIWFCQGVVILRGSLPFFMTTKAHFLDEDRPSSVVLADVIDNWMNVATATHNNCITIMDSYYTSHEACKCLQQNNLQHAKNPISRLSKIYCQRQLETPKLNPLHTTKQLEIA